MKVELPNGYDAWYFRPEVGMMEAVRLCLPDPERGWREDNAYFLGELEYEHDGKILRVQPGDLILCPGEAPKIAWPQYDFKRNAQVLSEPVRDGDEFPECVYFKRVQQ